ncbi:hypothetical protein KEM55_001075, partial [Ascosphaera atra]
MFRTDWLKNLVLTHAISIYETVSTCPVTVTYTQGPSSAVRTHTTSTLSTYSVTKVITDCPHCTQPIKSTLVPQQSPKVPVIPAAPATSAPAVVPAGTQPAQQPGSPAPQPTQVVPAGSPAPQPTQVVPAGSPAPQPTQ